MDKIFVLPPIIFIFISIIVAIAFLLLSKLSYRNNNNPEGKFKSYACGEEPATDRRKPNYSQFFPFAFFFTVMHVVVLLIATLPLHISGSLFIVLLFLVVAFISIPILFRD